MLFLLSDSLKEYASTKPPNQSVLAGIDLLCLAFREGKHIIAGAPATLDALRSIPGLQTDTRATLLNVRERFSQLMALPARYATYCCVISHDAGGIHETNVGAKRIIEVPINHFSVSHRIQRTAVLGEHLDDVAIADLMAKYYRQQQGFTTIPVQIEPVCGGGGNIATVFANIRNSRDKFCVAVADSDKKSPAAAMGSTARALLAEHAGALKSPLMDVVILVQCREMENIIPTEVFRQVFERDANHNEAWPLLSGLVTNGSVEARCFIDIKDGITFSNVLGMPAASPERAFWEAHLITLRTNSPLAAAHNGDCDIQDTCLHPEACRCWFLRPAGNGILGAASLILNRWGSRQWQTLEPYLSPIWLNVGRVVFEWGSGWNFSTA